MASISCLPLDVFMDIIKYLIQNAVPTPPSQNKHDRRDQLCQLLCPSQYSKAWRFATFKLDPGDTFAPFDQSSNFALPLGDPLRVQLLRSLTVNNSTPKTCNQILRHVNLTGLQQVRFATATQRRRVWFPYTTREERDEHERHQAAGIECIANAFVSAQKPLRLREFSLEIPIAGKKYIRKSLQKLLNSFEGAPLEELCLRRRFNSQPFYRNWCALRVNAIHRKLTSIKISQHVVLDDLAAAAPNLQSLSVFVDSFETERVYSMTDFMLPNLRKVSWEGDNWAASLLTLPSATLSVIKDLDTELSWPESLAASISKVLPCLRSLETFTVTHGNGWERGWLDWRDIPSIQHLSQVISTTSTTLHHISLPGTAYDPDVLIGMLQKKPSLRHVTLFIAESDRPTGI
ncbi:hypothetical protein HDV00_011495 [Rhizophlyctis rosea]|nr:hypothetical protein HDV00_011495 [Rhizophlyctis rosea]